MGDELAKAQAARIAAEDSLSSGLAAADDESHGLRQQLLSALQKARDAELRAAGLHERNERLTADQQVGPVRYKFLKSCREFHHTIDHRWHHALAIHTHDFTVKIPRMARIRILFKNC